MHAVWYAPTTAVDSEMIMKEERTRSLVFLNVSTSRDWSGSALLDEDDVFQPENYGWRVIRILKMTESGKHNNGLQRSCSFVTVYCFTQSLPHMQGMFLSWNQNHLVN